eukprot:CAMPEP_0195019938 /NCGR_PEP_ID=MMETSP0326_2-20130528/33973_1 /TAXON_ID=2866 ORGANISM="Crypthecodinium cohnii, Strain Seligo" /NCGR_SAMPLE_ID=MMETSP0326_2 /ASSEMBLY_ACC=CAM_ASM_000348 /LENGTH=84 /DNA_ID=CAMNT_0040038283 /DNA_START=92 /DNA_END=342 /DNA_ORIENTATION=+
MAGTAGRDDRRNEGNAAGRPSEVSSLGLSVADRGGSGWMDARMVDNQQRPPHLTADSVTAVGRWKQQHKQKQQAWHAEPGQGIA